MTSTAHVTESHLLTLARTAGQDAGRAGFIIPDGQSGHVLQFLTDQLVRIGKAQRWRDPAGYATAMISNAYDKGYEETRSATAEAPQVDREWLASIIAEDDPANGGYGLLTAEDDGHKCRECDGTGDVHTGNGLRHVCSPCAGTGYATAEDADDCADCGGDGIIPAIGCGEKYIPCTTCTH